MVNTNRENIDYEPLGDNTFQILNHVAENNVILKIHGYQYNAFHQFLYHLIAIIFFGIPYIIYSWYTTLRILKYKKCSLKNADIILLNDDCDQSYILQIHTDCDLQTESEQYNNNVRYFIHQHVKYIWENDNTQFVALKLPYETLTLNDIIENSNGLTISAQENALKLYGFNAITIDVKSYFKLLLEEVFNPFYLFQIFSIGLWSCDEYYIYAGCILFLSVVSIVTSLYETKKQSLALHDLVESSRCKFAQICRRSIVNNSGDENENNFNVETIDCNMLAPDDLIVLPSEGCVMPCDAVLLTGLCIVNESMLTGESVPVTKIPPVHSEEIYNVDIHKRHTIFAGTQVIQTRFYGGNKVIARVLRTGFHTSKGELIKSILYPKPTGLQFYRDSMKFVLFLSIIATMGMVYCVYLYAERRANLKEIFIRALDIITIVVPPALPAAMTVGTIYSQNRLKKQNIYCISPPRINVCGKLKLICFDKTGTLTQDGLEFYGVLPKNDIGQFDDLVQEPWSCLNQSDAVIHGMATCHSLTCIDNQLTGDPLDLGMFEATKWVLEEPGEENQRYDMLAPTVVKPLTTNSSSVEMDASEYTLPCEIGILRQFPFSSTQQCMSVICRKLGARHMTVFTKGAPERIQAMCDPTSLPDNFANVLANYAASGYRVIAIAQKQLHRKVTWRDALKMKRDLVECDLQFLGLIIMQNALKPETIPVINELHAAQIRTVMVTGDNIMTAISVSRNCGMVLPNETIVVLRECCSDSGDSQPRISVQILGSTCSNTNADSDGDNFEYTILQLHEHEGERIHIALDGKTWSALKNYYSNTTVARIVRHGTIFARFRPEQKTQLVEELQALDYIVGMCGDGANDCGALRAANIGVSLSQAEASIAAPFTSAVQDISCVKHLILEGRCSLVTSFAVFKYMAMYSLIQFFTVLILYKRYTTLGNMQFLYIDLVITTSLAVTMGYQGPATFIVAKRPMGSLVSLVNLIPLMMQVSLCALIQYGSLYYLTLQPWFTPLLKSSYVDEEVVVCWENTVVFCISCYQYVILACVYSKGHPYRKSILTNGLLILTCITLIIFTTVLLVYPVGLLAEYFEMIPFTYDKHIIIFRAKLLLFPLVHFILAFSIEIFVGQRKYLKHIVHFIVRKKVPKNKYKLIENTVNVHQWLDICSHS